MATTRRACEINALSIYGIRRARPFYRFQYILLHQLGATRLGTLVRPLEVWKDVDPSQLWGTLCQAFVVLLRVVSAPRVQRNH